MSPPHAAMLAAAYLVLGATAAAAQSSPKASSFSLSGGASYTTGDYGAPEKTEILIVPVSARYRTGALRLSATLPYVRIDSPGTVFGGVDGGPIIVDPDTPMGRRVRKGAGDLTLGGTYSIIGGRDGALLVDLGARVKLPTASKRKRLGTGKTDAAFSVDVSRQFGRVAPFANVAYRFFGDPQGWDLRNGFAASAGTSVQVGQSVAIVSYDYSRAASRFIGDAHELFAGFSGPAAGRLGWTAFATVGLSDGAPDAGVGLLLTYRLN